MFVIRQQQMEAFDEATLAAFHEEMFAHSQEFSPRLCEILGEQQLRVALRQAMQRADDYGFTNRGPIRLYIELMFLYGSDFDTDPQYPAMGEALKSSADQMERAERMYRSAADYQDNVSGEENIHVRKSLEYLADFAGRPATFSAHDFEAVLLEEMKRAFPQKVVHVGREPLMALIREGRTVAAQWQLSSLRAQALVITLMFAFGHGCTRDPLYPWISRTLADETLPDPEARAKRLEKKSLTWLRHVLAGSPEGVPS